MNYSNQDIVEQNQNSKMPQIIRTAGQYQRWALVWMDIKSTLSIENINCDKNKLQEIWLDRIWYEKDLESLVKVQQLKI